MWDINAKREVSGSPRCAQAVHPHAKFDLSTPIWSTVKGRSRKQTIYKLMSKATRRGVCQKCWALLLNFRDGRHTRLAQGNLTITDMMN